jgi:hypothetical protein
MLFAMVQVGVFLSKCQMELRAVTKPIPLAIILIPVLMAPARAILNLRGLFVDPLMEYVMLKKGVMGLIPHVLQMLFSPQL